MSHPEPRWNRDVDLKQYLASINHTTRYDGGRGGRGGGGGDEDGEGNGWSTGSDNDDADSDYWLESGPVILLVILYCIIVFGGVVGNTSLVINLCTQTSARFRNPLMVALCLADLLVTGVSAPLTLVALFMAHQTWSVANISCKTIYFMQSMPVAASTISLLMLSLDRYATVKHSRLTQLRERRFLPGVLALGAWMSAVILCTPYLLFYRIVSGGGSNNGSTTDECSPDYGSSHLHVWFICVFTLFVFVVPALGVLLNHLGVRKKLCALSLTARAAHGELPLPMPILRRPTHMIIVTGMANNGRGGGVVDNDSSDDDAGAVGVGDGGSLGENGAKNNGQEKRCMMTSKMRCNPRTPRSIRREHNSKQKQRGDKMPSSELPLPQTSTLRSRRRLANMLVAAALIFVCCWSPHVVCFLCYELGAANVCPDIVSDYCLLLGYAHSALSPILYWILNHNSLRQSSFLNLSSVHRFMRSHLRVPAPPPPPSSTNEAALGPFNPRYIKARPQQQQYRGPASSYNLY